MPPHEESPSQDGSVLRRALVVEDVDATRNRIAGVLRRNGYYVDEAINGLDGLKKVASRRFDVILLDLVLPEVDGFQFRRTQLRHPELASIPTVLVTVKALRDSDRYVLQPHEVIQKPFEDVALLAAISRACAPRPRTLPPPPPRSDSLYWSRRGEVACWDHAPKDDTERWYVEQWSVIPDGAGKNRVHYQCQHCPDRSGPVGHRKRSA
jgi:CheY-like chemotaxis protein